MARIIVVTSGKGGVGKSTIVSQLGKALARRKNKVLLIDADLGLKNLDIILDLESRVIFDIADLIKGRCSISQSLVQDKQEESLFLLPASIRVDSEPFDHSFLKKIINEIDGDFDFILIDSPAGIEKGFVGATKYAKEALIVVTLDKTSIKDADKVIGILKSNAMTNINLIVNRVHNAFIEQKSDISIDGLQRVLNQKIIGIVKEDKQLTRIGQHRDTYINHDVQEIANRILGIKERKAPSFFERLIKSKS